MKLNLVLILLVISGCAAPCDCGTCNKNQKGQCMKCTDVNCTPLGKSPCCDKCRCK